MTRVAGIRLRDAVDGCGAGVHGMHGGLGAAGTSAGGRLDAYARDMARDEAEIERETVRGEPMWPVALTMAVVIVISATMPDTLLSWPRWVAPVVFLGFAIAMFVMDPGRIDKRTRSIHLVRLGYVLVLVAYVVMVTVQLTTALVQGEASITNSARTLLIVGSEVWLTMAMTFAFLYWEMDLGGPGERANTVRQHPDFAFPQDMNPEIAKSDWQPEFLDYLYLGLTNNIAFSPTDVMPLSHRAKAFMALQSVASLLVLGLVIARAVNILQ